MVNEIKNLISVVMPAYNAENYISETIESVLSQTYKNFEFIIVEDKSTDNTAAIIQNFAKKDPRIIVVTHAVNTGIIAALNDGLKIAKGEYIARIDCDDICMPNRFAIQAKYLQEHPDVFMVGSNAINIDDQGNELREIRIASGVEVVVENLKKKITPLHPSLMFRNTGEVYYRDKALISEDLDMYLRLIYDGKKIDSLPIPLIKYRTLSTGLSSSKFVRQKLFGDKMMELYNNRVKTGIDGYDNFDINELLTVEASPVYIQETDRFNAMLLFNTNKFREFRVKSKEYFKKYGIFDMITLFYVCSFLPLGLIDILRRVR